MEENIKLIFILLIMFQLKHFICDYLLQNRYMLGKAGKDNWFKPLLAHSSVHSLGTLIIVSFLNIKLAFILALLDLILHFIVDRIKASPYMLNRWSIDKPYFWWALGLDQMIHHLFNYIFIFIIISNI